MSSVDVLNEVDIDVLNNKFMSKFSFSSEDKAEILAKSYTVGFERDDTIYTKDKCLGFIIVKSGELRAFILNPSFKEMNVFSLKPLSTCVLCNSCVVDNYEMEINLQAKDKTEIIVIPSEVYKNLRQKYKEIEIYTLQIISLRLADTINVVQQALFLPLVERIRNFLHKNAVNGEIRITHWDLALSVGSAREAVSRVLKDMHCNGEIVLKRGLIKIKM